MKKVLYIKTIHYRKSIMEMKPIPEKTYIVCRPSDGWRKTYITEKSAIEALNANPKNVLYEYTLTKVVKNEI